MVSEYNAELRYLEAPDTTMTKGVIPVADIREIHCEGASNIIEIVTQERTYYCQAESEVLAQEWYTKIHSCQLRMQKANE